MEIKGKTIILTGAARVGKAVARELAQKGANLAVVYRSSEADAKEIQIECVKLGSKVELFQGDLTIETEVKRVVEEIKKKFTNISALVHMAANYSRTPWNTLKEEDWDKTMNIIAKSAFLMTKHVADEMKKNTGEVKGKIITITDWSILTRPYKDYLSYNAAKAAVLGITKSLAKELAPDILVNAIAPGPILRPPDLTEEENREVLKDTPLQRWGGAEEIAKAVLYLIEADFVTGHELVVDGGRTIW